MTCADYVEAKPGIPPTPRHVEDIIALMRDRHHVDRSSNCPHGRPTALRLTLRDLERQFKRA